MSATYTGQSFDKYGIFEFDIRNEQVAKVVEILDGKYNLDWFKPHYGPSYKIGEKVQFLSEPENRADIARKLRAAGLGIFIINFIHF